MMKAVAYMRTSSATNVGEDKDSLPRQRAAIDAYATSAGYSIDKGDYFYDPAVKGADFIDARPGFLAMLARIQSNGVRTIIVETAGRFARELMTQEIGFDMLRKQGIALIAADSPSAFLDDGPTSRLIRQVLGAVAEFEKAMLVAKLKAARMRKKQKTGKCSGRKSLAELRPDHVRAVKEFALPAGSFVPSLRNIAKAMSQAGYATPSGKPYAASAIKSMLNQGRGT